MTDQEIIALYFKRSESAIEETERKYGSYCHYIAMNILYNDEDSKECVNDTWLNTWNAIPPAKPSILKTFIGKITRNLALNLYEKQNAKKRGKSETSYVLDELSECLADEKVSQPEAVAERLTLTECINQFLEKQPTDARKIFVRRYWYVASVNEIAAEYGFSESKVKMTLSRMRTALKNELEQAGICI
ncbi:RNA polymerase sigma factor [Oribacterium sp. WCC10]|uniref:RNA polymerase sigma factor n=1 Tax=Oribacterium sp. WCC10 TaxID=1855343 RepID=UPI0008E7ED0F|nr:sigma-70 family RNA polymerase sigma factor [Oribacterium sp. WCC10]SFG47745.1 RNA polymerase sigma-70 factor, ECF subfamily [Oribacterium sp. WCC10]